MEARNAAEVQGSTQSAC